MHVYFYEAFAEEADALRRLLPSRIVAGYTDRTIQEAAHDAPPAPLISVRTQSRLPSAWAPRLTGILSRSTGYDHLTAYAAALADLPGHADARVPQLGYLPLYCHRAVAEQAMTVWMMLLRRLPLQQRHFATFHRDGLTGSECRGRTLAVVGVGHIGSQVAALGHALGMRVLGVDLDPRHDGVEYTGIDDALAAADVVVCAMNLTPANRGYFDADRLARIKPGAVFVNVARGELSPATALLPALESGHLAGVGLDVYDHEPELAVALRAGSDSTSSADTTDPEIRATLALAARPDAVCTPHNAFNTHEAVERKSDHSVQQITAHLDAGSFLWQAPTPR